MKLSDPRRVVQTVSHPGGIPTLRALRRRIAGDVHAVIRLWGFYSEKYGMNPPCRASWAHLPAEVPGTVVLESAWPFLCRMCGLESALIASLASLGRVPKN